MLPEILRESAVHPGPVASVYLEVHRTEEVWARNARDFAADVDRAVSTLHAELVILTGDVRARSLVLDALGERSRAIIEQVPGPGPDDHTTDRPVDHEVRRLTAERATARTRDVLEQFEHERGRTAGLGVTGLGPVIRALQHNQVGTLLLVDAPSSELRLWIGPEPLQLALTEDDLRGIGAPVLGQDRADAALLRAVAGSGADLVLLPHPAGGPGSRGQRRGWGTASRWATRPRRRRRRATPGGQAVRGPDHVYVAEVEVRPVTVPVVIESRGGNLRGDLAVPARAVGIVVFAHGSGSSRHSRRNRAVAEILQRSGFATLLLDLLTEAEEQMDARTAELRFNIGLLAGRVSTAVEQIREQAVVATLPVGLFGASTGAAAALVAAAHDSSIRAVVSRGGRPDLAGDALRRVQAPTLLIVGSLDVQVLDLNRQASVQLAAVSRIEVVQGATHLFEEPGALEEVARSAAGWFDDHVAT